ncbi:MAG: hypothetical protein Kow00127_16310 [Bacteroidales bacterium]
MMMPSFRPSLLLIAVLFTASYIFGQEKTGTQPFGAELTPLSEYDSIQLVNLPELKMPDWLKGPNGPVLPPAVDNSTQIYWRPVFAQVALECGQASGIGMAYTYAVNRLRNLPSNVPENQYATHFTWNFGNGGEGWYGVSYFHSFEIVRTLGTPNVITYGGMSAGGGSRWLSGYDNYYELMKNRLYEIYKIDVSTEEGILTAKHWIHNHLEGADVGGVANFYANAPYGMSTLPPGTPEAGMYVVTSWSSANHAMTIAAYNDSIRWDYNNDGIYTNDIDINGDGEVNVRDWEIGGFRFANTYSGGPSFGNNGFSYMTYKSCADPYGQGGIWDNSIHVIYARENCEPLLTARITITDVCRNTLRVRMGVSTDLSSESPQYAIEYPVFNFQGGCKYMQAGTTEEDKTIEFGLDLTPLINLIGPGVPARYFLLVDEDDPNNWGSGEVVQFSVIDYTNGVNEIPSAQSNVNIANNTTTKLWVDHTLNFTPVSVDQNPLPPATVYEPYSAQLTATGGTYPYIWDFDRNFTETLSSGSYPAVTAQQLYPGTGYTTKDLEFSFPFYGEHFESVRVYADGYLMFGQELNWPYQVYDFLKFTKNRIVAPFMADLSVTSGSGSGVWFEGDENHAVFRWKAVVSGAAGSTELNFAVELLSNGDIRFYYGPVNEFSDLDWKSGVSAGNNKYYQFTQVSGKESITPNTIVDLEAASIPEGFSLSHDGVLSGVTAQTLDNFPVNVMCSDQNNLTARGILYLSTDGSNYVVVQDYTVTSGDDQVIEPGESASLSVEVKNLGDETVEDVTMSISTSSPYVTLTDSTETLGSFASGQVIPFDDAFAFEVGGNIPNQFTIDLQTHIESSSGESWNSHIYLTAYAPELYCGSTTIVDGGNSTLDPGETAEMHVAIINSGGADAYEIAGNLSTSDPYITINDGSDTIPQITAYNTGELIFTITADENAPLAHLAEFSLEFSAGIGNSGTGTPTIVIGQTPVLLVDLDPNSSSAPAMADALQELGVPFESQQSLPASLLQYSSVFVCLGIYSDNHVLSDDEGQQLANYLNAGGNLYMEGGDTWYYDPQTPVHPMFNIDPESDGTGDLDTVLGQSSTLTDGMAFNYSGQNSWIDHISPLDTAQLIFANSSPEYGCAVSWNSGQYKTIGASFEFGGLDDAAQPSTKKDLMQKYLEFFGVISFDLIGNFQADTTSLCAGSSTGFTDYSIGNPVSWNWTFEGGIPPTSTEPSPVVTYPDAGVWDVTLIVSNGFFTDTVTKDNYIIVYPVAGVPALPAGPTTVYTNLVSQATYITAGATYASSYEWEFLPEEAGNVEGTGATATVNFTSGWQGTATLRVRGVTENCGPAEWSDPLLIECVLGTGTQNPSAGSIILFPNPAKEKVVVKTSVGSAIREIRITDLSGKIVMVLGENEIQKEKAQFTPPLRKGVVIVKVITDNGVWLKKLVVDLP